MPEPIGFTIGIESETIVVRHTGVLSVQEIEASRQAVAELAGLS